MNTWVAFLRGINVGGRNALRMKELATALADADCGDVMTYLQTGNVVFRSSESSAAALEARIERVVKAIRDIEVRVLALSSEELRKAIAANPFPQAESAPKTLHLFFLSKPPVDPDVESFVLTDGVFYIHAPNGMSWSKLAARVEKLLGVDATARNWRTVSKVMEMVEEIGEP
ncbi:MAG: hypothetical protein CL694_14410 [Chloroflexi bacterium]|jgi:uncharacterized protein (DUF1697 family)|nr:hypothetical protein [Chloroflexota bacterium]MDP6664761.1 DUF1697 domain-containing protein [SAR202 cluster bacterium]